MDIRPRTYFLEKDLRYVFSYTLELSMNREEIGLVPGGVRVNVFSKGKGQLFQVLNERAPWAENNVRGEVLEGGADWLFLGDDDVARVDVRLAFKTVDGAYIESSYRGMSSLGGGGYREFLREKDSRGEPTKGIGTSEKPFLARTLITPTYETADPRYKWLTKLQCIGFGYIKFVDGQAQQGDFDIYAMM